MKQIIIGFLTLLPLPGMALNPMELFNREEQTPPNIQPFQLPTLTGETVDFRGTVAPLVEAPKIDADGIFAQAVNCYPEPTKFNVEVHLEGGLRSQGIITADNTTIGKNYAGIVARMPLYSPTAMNREREREYLRRTATSELIGRFVMGIATRNHARRSAALYEALEARAQVRVQKGLTGTDEQVGYMEKLLAAHETELKAEADITAARLAIAGQCAEHRRAELNNWLKRMAVLPKEPGA